MSRRRTTRPAAGPRRPKVPAPAPTTPAEAIPAEVTPDALGGTTGHHWPRGTAQRLRGQLLRFAQDELGPAEEEHALRLFTDAVPIWGDGQLDAVAAGLTEWLINDYETEAGGRVVDRILATGGVGLGHAEREMLAVWRAENYLHLFEVQSVRPGCGVEVEDLLSGERMAVADRSASRTVLRWELLLARPQSGDERRTFTGAMLALPPRHKPALLASVRGMWEAYLARHPDGTMAEFSRRHGLDMLAAMQVHLAMDARPQQYVSEEGHEPVAASADFDIPDGRSVTERLRASADFAYGGPSPQVAGALYFVWRYRAETLPPPVEVFPMDALMLRTDIGLGGLDSVVHGAGEVWVWSNRLRLKCLSRERLAAGKQLLASLLGPALRHREDQVGPFGAGGDASPSDRAGPAPTARSGPRRLGALDPRSVERYTDEWLSSPIPTLGGQTPREAVQTEAGRAQVIELLKTLDYYAQQSRRRGEPPSMNLARIHRELGLPPPAP